MAEEHDHDDHELDDDEIEITINPREEDLDGPRRQPRGVRGGPDDDARRYDQAIDVEDPDAIAPLEEAEITLGGKVYRLREVADIAITGGLEGLGEDDEEGRRGRVNRPARAELLMPKSAVSSGFFLESAVRFAYHRQEPTPSTAPGRRPRGPSDPLGMGDATPTEPPTPRPWSPDGPAREDAGCASMLGSGWPIE